MKIAIRDFGPISSFDIDLDKDLHIIYGENNIGKSYAIVLVYLITKGLREVFKSMTELYGYLLFGYIRNAKGDPSSIPSKGLDISDQLWSVGGNVSVAEFIKNLNQSVLNSFGEFHRLRNRRGDEQPKIYIRLKGYEMFLVCDPVTGFSMKEAITHNRTILIHQADIPPVSDKGSTFLIVEELEKADFRQMLEIETMENLIVNEVRSTCEEAFFLPASRSGLYSAISIFGSVFAKLSQLRHVIREKIEIPTLSEPVSDYFLQLSTISKRQRDDVFSQLGLKMEAELIGASIDFNLDSKKLEYHDANLGLSLDLSEVSSMVAELAPIVAYLKYVLTEDSKDSKYHGKLGKVLFIEEPEAHMHPKVQLKLMEFFAELSKVGVTVIMTTHSNYIFNKASNLILEGKLSEEKVQNYHMIATDKGSIVNPHDTLSEMGFVDENFVDVAEQLLDERLIALEGK